MFGGTPTNLSLPFLSEHGRDRDRREPADADQGLRAARGRAAPRSRARCASRARARSTWRARSWSSGGRDPARARDPQPARAARARGRALRAHRQRLPRAGHGRPRRAYDGRQVDPGHPAAGRVAGHRRSSWWWRARTRRQAMAALVDARRGRASGRDREHAARQRASRRASRSAAALVMERDAAPVFRLAPAAERRRGRGGAAGAARSRPRASSCGRSRSASRARWARRTPTSSTRTC